MSLYIGMVLGMGVSFVIMELIIVIVLWYIIGAETYDEFRDRLREAGGAIGIVLIIGVLLVTLWALLTIMMLLPG